VVNAMAAGKYAALQIDGMLQGGQLKDSYGAKNNS